MGHYFRGAALACIAGAIGRVPVIIPLHGSANLFPYPKRFIYKIILRTADKAIYNSEFTARSFNYLGNNEVIYNGLQFKLIPAKTEFSPGQRIKLLAIGGLMKIKQYHVLLGMLQFLPEQYSLTIIGDGQERAGLERLARTSSVSGRVLFKGYVENAYKEFADHDIFLHPAIDESFGIAVAESLFACVPVIVTDKCAPYEVVGGGEYGWIASSNSPESWADLVVKIVAKPEESWAKATKGREWAVRMFSDVAFSGKMDKIVEEATVKS
jgi:glycosyltransferase involved in cell wall biosynthesis